MSGLDQDVSLGVGSRRLRARPPRTPQMWLRQDEAEIWRVSLDAVAPEIFGQLQSLLAEEEVARARRFFFERDRRRVVVARAVLRLLLARYTGANPREFVLVYGPNGKPALAPAANAPEVFFNVAHSEQVALFAFTRAGEIGVDVERIREVPEWESIARACFRAGEATRLGRLPAEQRRLEFFRAWAHHEAVMKALGHGLAGDVTDEERAGLSVQPLDVGPQFAAAVATALGIRAVVVRTASPSELSLDLSTPFPTRRVALHTPSQPAISFP